MTTRRQEIERAVTLVALGINRHEQQRIVIAMMRLAWATGATWALGDRDRDVQAAFDQWIDEK